MSQNTSMDVDSISTPRAYDPRFQETSKYYTPLTYNTPSSDLFATGGFPSIVNSSIVGLETGLQSNDRIYFSNDIIQKYAEVYENTRPQEDIGSAPDSYEKMCYEYSNTVREETSGIFNIKSREYQLWEAERNTWNLLKLLSQYRFTPIKDADEIRKPFQTDGQLLCELLANNKNFAEAWIVRQWLWKIAPKFVTVETNPEYRSFTKNSILLDPKKRDSDIYKYLDPDGPHRTNRALDNLEQEHEEELARSIFEYLRRGQVDDAMDISDKNSHFWRTASMSGIVLYNEKVDDDGDITTVGNINRHIWRATCYHCANQESLYIYDRAIYGVLSGDYENILPVCRTWEDQVWAYYHSLIECKQDEYFSKHVRHMGVSDDDDLPINIRAIPPKEIFEIVESKRVNSDPDIEMFHIIQKLIILNDPMEIIKQLKEEIVDKRLGREDEISYVHFLRLTTHLILYLRDLVIPTSDKESDNVIKLYTELLIEYRQNKLIALYASKLPRDISIEIYSSFLKDITSSYTERHKLLSLAEQYGLDVVAIARRTFELIFQGIESADRYGRVSDIRIVTLQEPISSTEEIQIRALEWLTYNKEQHREALKLGNTLCRRFLASGKMNVAGRIIIEMKNSQSPLSIIRYVKPEENDDDEIDSLYVEHNNYYNMIEYFNKYEIWLRTWNSKPKKSNSDEWKKRIKEVSSSLDNLFDRFLKSYIIDIVKDKNMMTDEDEIRIRELERVMDIYIPNAVLRHHKALYETRDIIPEHLEKSFNLANLVVEENTDLSMHFRRSKKLQTLIMALRDSYLEILRRSPNDISNVLNAE